MSIFKSESGIGTSVAFGSDGCSEDDDVLGDGGVDEVHSAHSSTSIVEDPDLLCVDVSWVTPVQSGDDLGHQLTEIRKSEKNGDSMISSRSCYD